MDVFRFVKRPMRANDPTRRYQLVRGHERDYVGDIEVNDASLGDVAVVLTLVCFPVLSDAAREDALSNTRRFLEELVTGWGLTLGEATTESEWVEQADGNFLVRLEYAIV